MPIRPYSPHFDETLVLRNRCRQILLVILAQKMVKIGQTMGVARVGKRNTTTVRKQNNYKQKYVKSTDFGQTESYKSHIH